MPSRDVLPGFAFTPDGQEIVLSFDGRIQRVNVESGSVTEVPFTADETVMSADVRVPVAGIPVRLKVETADCPPDGSDVSCFFEVDAFPTMDDAWETVSWDFVGIDTSLTYVKATIFFDFGTAGDGSVYYWDNVRFGAAGPSTPGATRWVRRVPGRVPAPSPRS